MNRALRRQNENAKSLQKRSQSASALVLLVATCDCCTVLSNICHVPMVSCQVLPFHHSPVHYFFLWTLCT
jgi:hypothetical protein